MSYQEENGQVILTMTQLIIPWLATFLFGLVVFAIGKVLQFGEMKKRAQRGRRGRGMSTSVVEK